MNQLVPLLISHILGDGIFTSSRLAILKRKPRLSHQVLATGWHASIHAFLAGLLLLLASRYWMKAAFLVFAVHFFIDFIRCHIEIRLFGQGRLYLSRSEFIAWVSKAKRDQTRFRDKRLLPWFLINILDQAAHIASLYAISLLI